MLGFDPGRGDRQISKRRDREKAVEPCERLTCAVRNGRIESVPDSAVTQLSKPGPVPEHLVSDNEKEVILRQVEHDEFSRPIEEAKRESHAAALRSQLQRQPSIFGTAKQVLNGQESLGTRDRRHV